jgi:hypothetical protein
MDFLHSNGYRKAESLLCFSEIPQLITYDTNEIKTISFWQTGWVTTLTGNAVPWRYLLRKIFNCIIVGTERFLKK